MRRVFATAVFLVSSAFSLKLTHESTTAAQTAATEQQNPLFPTDLAQATHSGDEVDITDYTGPEDDGTWTVE